MENRSLSVVALLSGLLLMPLPALADNGSDAQQMADWAQRPALADHAAAITARFGSL